MNRLMSYRYCRPIERALEIVPPAIRARLAGVHFLTGTDPIAAGLHGYRETRDGRSYLDVAHVVYPFHQGHLPADRRRTTVVLPYPDPHPASVVHELGHALHEALGFEHDADPVTEYARTNRFEAFAEAFTTWFFWHGEDVEDSARRLFEDRPTMALFEALRDEKPLPGRLAC